MTTPSQPNNELDKAIEQLEKDLENGFSTLSFDKQIEMYRVFLAAAKRSKELEKERDESRAKNKDLKWELSDMHEQRRKFEQQLSTLRADYKQALEALETAKRAFIEGGTEEDLIVINEVLSTPSAIEAMKGEA